MDRLTVAQGPVQVGKRELDHLGSLLAKCIGQLLHRLEGLVAQTELSVFLGWHQGDDPPYFEF